MYTGKIVISVRAEEKEQCDNVASTVIGALMIQKGLGRMKDVSDCNVHVEVSEKYSGTERYSQDIV